MKGGIFSILALLTLLLIFSSTPSLSQERSKVVSVNPVGAIFGNLGLEYQKNINKSSAWAVRGTFWSLGSGNWKASAFGAGGSYRWFLEPTAPEEFYVGGGLDLESFTATLGGESSSTIILTPKAEAGYRWLLFSKKHFTVSIGVEAYFFIGNIKIANENWPFGGFHAGLVGSLGYAW
jgi:hypothetical protein